MLMTLNNKAEEKDLYFFCESVMTRALGGADSGCSIRSIKYGTNVLDMNNALVDRYLDVLTNQYLDTMHSRRKVSSQRPMFGKNSEKEGVLTYSFLDDGVTRTEFILIHTKDQPGDDERKPVPPAEAEDRTPKMTAMPPNEDLFADIDDLDDELDADEETRSSASETSPLIHLRGAASVSKDVDPKIEKAVNAAKSDGRKSAAVHLGGIKQQ